MISALRVDEQLAQGGDVIVPFNQRRHGTDPHEYLLIKGPDGVIHG